MKTSHYTESFNLCHPQTLGSEHSNNQSIARNSIYSSELLAKNETISNNSTSATTLSASSSTVAQVAAYGSNSSDQHHSSKCEYNANELQLKNQQQHQEQNKKRKRETGEKNWIFRNFFPWWCHVCYFNVFIFMVLLFWYSELTKML